MNESDYDPRIAELIGAYIDRGLMSTSPPRPNFAAADRSSRFRLLGSAAAVVLIVAVAALVVLSRPGFDVTGVAPDGAANASTAPAIEPTSPPSPALTAMASPSPASGALDDLIECHSSQRPVGGLSSGWNAMTPIEALHAFLARQLVAMPGGPYIELESTSEETIYAFRQSGLIKAVIRVSSAVHSAHTGWEVSDFRACPTVEFEPGTDFGPGVIMWSHSSLGAILERPGAAHCGWERVRFLTVGGRQYVRDPERALDSLPTFATVLQLPDNAASTGYRHGADELWMTADGEALYVVTPDVIEQWPTADPPYICR